MTKAERDQLELMIDAHGLTKVVEVLSELCLLKQHLIEREFGASPPAKAFNTDAQSLAKVAMLICSDVGRV